jgi:glycosyltransferase involved in cell wall biosynthesis
VNNTDPQSGGGGDRRVLEEAREFAVRGHRPHLLVGRTDPEAPRRRRVDGVTVLTVKCLPDLFARFSRLYFYLTRMLFPVCSILSLVLLLHREEFDLVVDDFTPHPSLVAPLARAYSIPAIALVHEYHDRTALQKFHPLIGLVQLAVQNVLRTRLYVVVVVPRTYTKRRLREYGVTVPIEVVPNGLDFEPLQRHTGSGEQTYELLCVSRLVRRKGIDLLLEAMDELPAERSTATLAVAGRGPYREHLERMVNERGLEDRVDFLGYVSDERKVELLVGSDVFVLPSRQEGFGIAVLEAMATGCPVVVNDLPVLRELVPEDGGVFVDATDPSCFASALAELLDTAPDRRRRMGDRNWEEAKQYAWPRVADRAELVYLEYV